MFGILGCGIKMRISFHLWSIMVRTGIHSWDYDFSSISIPLNYDFYQNFLTIVKMINLVVK